MPLTQANTPPAATATPTTAPEAAVPVATAAARPILAPNSATPPEPPTRATATASPAALPAREAVRRYAELSPAQRSQMPTLSVSGGSYSANPAHRLLIVNGAVLQEGQTVAPGLTLEQIGANEAVLNHQGLRFRIGF